MLTYCVPPARLPDLRMVIVTDSRQTGTVHVEDVMQAGSRQHHQELQDLQTKLSFDDPINIQFTSVGLLLKEEYFTADFLDTD